jgi:hypothetical protein
MGAYHGKYGFDTFTHKRAVVQMPDWLDRFMGFRYPPYDLTKSNPMTTFSTPPFKRGETLQDCCCTCVVAKAHLSGKTDYHANPYYSDADNMTL